MDDKKTAFRVDNSSTSDISHAGKNIFFAAVETTRMPMLITDPKHGENPIIFANKAFLEMTGYGSEEIIGRNCRFLQGPETDRSTVAAVRDAIAEQREIAVEIINYKKDGSAFWNALYISPVLNEDGELIYFFASQLDVSRRRDAEDGLRQAQKMEALGQLTGGIAHDFNNLLQVMLGYISVIQRTAQDEAPDLDRVLKSASHAQQAAERASALTQQLLAFSRKQTLEGRVVNLNNVVRSQSDMAERTMQGVQLITHLDDQLWNCRVDPTQLDVAFLNVLLNARDALHGRSGPAVTIETANLVVDESSSMSYDGLIPGRYVSLSITDNGVGMPAYIKSRVMEPFFTTKEEGKGTGLGLSMVYGFVKQSGGTARIYSEENVGTTLRLYFPADDSRVAGRSAIESTDNYHGAARILIVEDRPDVADLADMVLTDFGYDTTVCYSAIEAIAHFKDDPAYDLLFTDLIMPGGMNGVMLAQHVRKHYPNVKILLTTGYSENSLERSDAGGAEFEVISKPYLPKDLGKKVRRVLAGPNGVS